MNYFVERCVFLYAAEAWCDIFDWYICFVCDYWFIFAVLGCYVTSSVALSSMFVEMMMLCWLCIICVIWRD